MNPGIFREYDIRGVADQDLSDSELKTLSRALGTFYRRHGAHRISVGVDARLSGPRIRKTMTEGLLSCGIDVIDIGMVPTPLLYFSVNKWELDGGLMITGSHNPPEYNGFKICLGPSTIHGEAIGEIAEIAKSNDFEKGAGTQSSRPVFDEYVEHVCRDIKSPLNVKVVVDAGNGAGGPVAVELYKRLGCDVIELFIEPDGGFPNHHPDPTVLENINTLIETVQSTGARLGIGFDGDADRIGVVDSRGEPLFGDELLAVFARSVLKEHPGTTVISEVKASHRLFQDVEKHGGAPLMWKTGHSLIKAKMKETGALLAGEMSGHIFFKDRYYGFDDAVYAGARLLEIVAGTGRDPRQVIEDLPGSHSTPEIRVDCPDEKKFSVVEESKSRFEKMGLSVNPIDGARVEFEDGWGLVRASNTQPVLVFRFEAETAARLAEIRQVIEKVVQEVIGE